MTSTSLVQPLRHSWVFLSKINTAVQVGPSQANAGYRVSSLF